MKTHDCGSFDRSLVEIKYGGWDGWVLWLEGDPWLSIKFCPYCGVMLVGAVRSPEGFDDYLPFTAVRTGPGEYDIMASNGHRLWFMEGAALADWVCASVNGYDGAIRAMNGGNERDREMFEAGWNAGFQEALEPDRFPEQNRCEVRYREMLVELARVRQQASDLNHGD